MTDWPRPILLAAGGTGGHLFPAEALAVELGRREVPVELVTDERALAYASKFPARAVHALPADTLRGSGALAYAKLGLTLARGVGKGVGLMRRVRPAAVVGFGGYPSFPPLVAGRLAGVPVVLHEQNAVMGRANRMLARFATTIATGFPDVSGAPSGAATVHVGNPVRPQVISASGVAYEAPDGDRPIRLLVFGGSQGARVMSEVVPAALALLPGQLKARLRVTQQARPEDLEAARAAYAAAGIEANLTSFFDDMPARMALAHFVIARAGASTVAELAVIGRPSILVPLPHALDNDQLANANALALSGGAVVWPQARLTPEALSDDLAMRLADGAALSASAAAARRVGKPDAAARLADVVLAAAGLHAPAPASLTS
ncbi:UDP-N-acetylglucosamine--N-acetylmuramyl-(pentapeptide) pyrophosphoryl-undecaprenol N-acetylglucosamine transferase [Methylopila capsulata]|uniref:UDP-N-acetylglucosamine--N-acetylmuramyl-(pentapeptide) pyrophosphoryl-undecaprenol N-acetylglucosamine transferase n=1 Tax=Methylopila capsulata TaxID=61654 RepID=A0A9W6MSC2_9HYPH|nr:undecaprenyldiphospho-muramoylpentapeptide beta-N-acetylglucosaminyltransferase [Methylopila capsulata]MBM7850576.1 UDP-N-acetylglucosamine--N-acetylmuramyl-(pentapeptide) pyrophosphoryl-undecaprenol N-acetylglucosamine transferase [Methylopila capsulata]GLK55871.1 UDP-N-acetylglucosamine--N-acetylmuramyl-(pentapeptide) pyrophosphoryl-undecaprenol N-acetylglucosamine transferase [Methylopila capsulata]